MDDTDRLCDEFEQVLTLRELIDRNGRLSQDTLDFISTVPVFSFFGIGTESYQTTSDINRRLEIGTEGFLDTIKKIAGTIKNKITKTIDQQTNVSANAIRAQETIAESAVAIAEKVEKAPETNGSITFVGLPYDQWLKALWLVDTYVRFLDPYLQAEIYFRSKFQEEAKEVLNVLSTSSAPQLDKLKQSTQGKLPAMLMAKANRLAAQHVTPLFERLFKDLKTTEVVTLTGDSKKYTWTVPDYEFVSKLHFEECTVLPTGERRKYDDLVQKWATSFDKYTQKVIPILKTYQSDAQKFRTSMRQEYEKWNSLYSKEERDEDREKMVVRRFQLVHLASNVLLQSMRTANRQIRQYIKAAMLVQKTARNYSNALSAAKWLRK